MSKKEPDYSDIYLWFDTEFTSLDLERSQLLQVAMVATDAKLQRLRPPEEDLNLIIRLEPEDRCDPWVEKNLADLVRRCRSPEAISVEEADSRLSAQLDRMIGTRQKNIKRRPVLAGNSLHADWFLSRKYLPNFLDRLNFRMLDVTSWKLYWTSAFHAEPFDKEDAKVVKSLFPGEFTCDAEKHDAYFDVLASIAEMNFYFSHLTICPQ